MRRETNVKTPHVADEVDPFLAALEETSHTTPTEETPPVSIASLLNDEEEGEEMQMAWEAPRPRPHPPVFAGPKFHPSMVHFVADVHLSFATNQSIIAPADRIGTVFCVLWCHGKAAIHAQTPCGLSLSF